MNRTVVALAVALVAACSTPKAAKTPRMMPPSENDASTLGTGPKDTHFAEVRKAAAEQLQCPEDQINIVCLHRDSEGECVSIRADGCEKSYEYQFGEPGG